MNDQKTPLLSVYGGLRGTWGGAGVLDRASLQLLRAETRSGWTTRATQVAAPPDRHGHAHRPPQAGWGKWVGWLSELRSNLARVGQQLPKPRLQGL